MVSLNLTVLLFGKTFALPRRRGTVQRISKEKMKISQILMPKITYNLCNYHNKRFRLKLFKIFANTNSRQWLNA